MFQVRFTSTAKSDLTRLTRHLKFIDISLAQSARDAIEKGIQLITFSPLSCRRADGFPAEFRELIIPFGHSGFVLLFEIESAGLVTVIAARHQREFDYF